jgi:hypothetical protein
LCHAGGLHAEATDVSSRYRIEGRELVDSIGSHQEWVGHPYSAVVAAVLEVLREDLGNSVERCAA